MVVARSNDSAGNIYSLQNLKNRIRKIPYIKGETNAYWSVWDLKLSD